LLALELLILPVDVEVGESIALGRRAVGSVRDTARRLAGAGLIRGLLKGAVIKSLLRVEGGIKHRADIRVQLLHRPHIFALELPEPVR
jgi:hypothetical protein